MKKIYAILFPLFIYSISIAQNSKHLPGNILAMLGSDNDALQMQTDLARLNGATTQLKIQRIISNSMHIYLFSFDASINENKMLNAVKGYRSTKLAEFNHYVTERATVPNDPMFTSMWDMNNDGSMSGSVADADIDAPEAWDITTGGLTAQGDSIVVAVIDGGFSLTHPDINFWKNYQEIPNNGIDDDMNGYIDDFDGWNSGTLTDNWTPQSHGTHVAGTIGARGNNGVGVTGVNWNVKVMPVVYGSGSGGTFEADVIGAYSYVRDERRLYNQTNGAKGAFVVATNSSFGIDLTWCDSMPLWGAIYDSLGAVGILSAAATANANYNIDAQGDMPTSCASNWLMTVTNTRNNDTKANAGFGSTTIDLGAPGTTITSTYYSGTTNTYAAISGTSMATPHVAGTVGLVYSILCSQFMINCKADPAGVALIVKDSILNSTDPIAALAGITVSGGRLNLYKAVVAMQNYCLAVGITNQNDPNNAFEISNVYPNPATQNLTVVINTFEPTDIVLTNVLGQELKRIHNENSMHGKQLVKMDISGMSKGIYLVSLQNKNKKSGVTKVVVY